MKFFNKFSALIAFISMKCAICRDSGLRQPRGSSDTNDIEKSVQDSSTEIIEKDLGFGGIRLGLFNKWNEKRSEINIQNLMLSTLANQLAQNMAQNMAQAQNIADTDEVEVDLSYRDYCHGPEAALVAKYYSIEPIFEEWFKSENGTSTMVDNIRFTGIGIARKSTSSSNMLYVVQIFCGFEFVNNLEVISTGTHAIRSSILAKTEEERHNMGLDEIQNSIPFQRLAQTWATDAALNNGSVSHHTLYRGKCYGAGGEVNTSGIYSDIQSLAEDASDTYIANGNIVYMGIGIAVRNDGCVFVVQLFCSLRKGRKKPDPVPLTWTEETTNFFIEKENDRRKKVARGSSYVALMTSSKTTAYAQEWADKLVDSDTISEDPQRKKGCLSHSFQIVAKGSQSEIWIGIFRNKKKLNMLQNHKYKYVGTGIARANDGQIILVQNFCFWRP